MDWRAQCGAGCLGFVGVTGVSYRVPGGPVGVIGVSYLQGARWSCIGVTCVFYFGHLGIRRSKICTDGTGL
jgi:hypothetical protein